MALGVILPAGVLLDVELAGREVLVAEPLSSELLLRVLLVLEVVVAEPLKEAELVVPTTELLVLPEAELGARETVVELLSMAPLRTELGEPEELLKVDVDVADSPEEAVLVVSATELRLAEDVLAAELSALLDVVAAAELLVKLLPTELLLIEPLVAAVTVAESPEEAVLVLLMPELPLLDGVLATEPLRLSELVCIAGVVEEASRSPELVDVSLDTDILEEPLGSELDSAL